MNISNNLKEKIKGLFIKENIYFLLFIIIFFLLDRISKTKILNNFNESAYYINDYVNINLIWNIGIGFGLLSTNSTIFYNIVTILIRLVIIFLIYFFSLSKKFDKLIYSIIIGGALGNFYDRLIFKVFLTSLICIIIIFTGLPLMLQIFSLQ